MMLIDIVLPDTNGWELDNAIFGSADCGRLPVMFFSGSPEAEAVFLKEQTKKTFFLAKPFDIEAIENIIDAMVYDIVDNVEITANNMAVI